MKKFISNPDSVWGKNGRDMGYGHNLKWPVILSTDEFDVYDVSRTNNPEFCIFHSSGILRYTADTVENVIELFRKCERSEINSD